MRRSFQVVALSALALALGLAVLPGRGFADVPKEAKNIELKDGKVTVEGEITNDDPKDRVRNFPTKLFAIKLKGKVKYTIDMVSKDVDSYLRLDNADGDELTKDDDSGGFPHARIKFTPAKDGTYVISATTFNGGTGAFTLKVAGEGAAVAGKETPLKDGKLDVADKLDAADPFDAKLNKSHAKVYLVPLKGGKTYQIDMASGPLDSFLRLEDKTGKELALDDDTGGGATGLDARITFECPNDGTYRIICTALRPGTTGEFTLKVEEK